MSGSGEWLGIKAAKPVRVDSEVRDQADIPSQGSDSCAALTMKVMLQLHFLQDPPFSGTGIEKAQGTATSCLVAVSRCLI